MFPIHDDTQRIHGRPYINYCLIAANAIVFIWELIVTDFFSNPAKVNEIFVNYGAIPIYIVEGKFGEIITSMFMHGGIAHIIGNMTFLFIFGDNVEDRFGHIKYLFLYLFWGIVAALVHSLYAISVGSGTVPAVGASGAVSGVLGAYLILFPRAKIVTAIMAFFVTTIRIPALAYIPFWFLLQVVFSVINPTGGVAYLAHIGGFLAGLACGFILKYIFKSGYTTFSDLNIYGLGNIGNNKNYSRKKIRPSINKFENNPSPEIIDNFNYYEIIVELIGVMDKNDISLKIEENLQQIRVMATGNKNYDFLIDLPSQLISPQINSVEFRNGILRMRVLK